MLYFNNNVSSDFFYSTLSLTDGCESNLAEYPLFDEDLFPPVAEDPKSELPSSSSASSFSSQEVADSFFASPVDILSQSRDTVDAKRGRSLASPLSPSTASSSFEEEAKKTTSKRQRIRTESAGVAVQDQEKYLSAAASEEWRRQEAIETEKKICAFIRAGKRIEEVLSPDLEQSTSYSQDTSSLASRMSYPTDESEKVLAFLESAPEMIRKNREFNQIYQRILFKTLRENLALKMQVSKLSGQLL